MIAKIAIATKSIRMRQLPNVQRSGYEHPV